MPATPSPRAYSAANAEAVVQHLADAHEHMVKARVALSDAAAAIERERENVTDSWRPHDISGTLRVCMFALVTLEQTWQGYATARREKK